MNENVTEEFVDAAAAHGASTDSGDAKGANRAHDRIMKTLAKIKPLSDQGEGILTALLDHENDSVKGWAATYLLPLNQEAAIATLEDIGAARGLVAFDAKMVLKLWREGTLKLVNWP